MNSYYFDSNQCNVCHNGELIFIENEGVIICNKCYNTNKYYIENDKPNYREPLFILLMEILVQVSLLL